MKPGELRGLSEDELAAKSEELRGEEDDRYLKNEMGDELRDVVLHAAPRLPVRCCACDTES